MAATDQDNLDAARDALNANLKMRAEEFGDDGERARMIRVEALHKLINDLEAKIAASRGNVFKPIREVSP